MPQASPAILTASRTLLRTLIVLNGMFALAFVAVLGASFGLEERLLVRLGDPARADVAAANLTAIRAVLVIGLVVVPFAHVIFARLAAIVDTVRGGDPFVPLNARRLTTIAWCMLLIQLLDLLFGAVVLGLAGDDTPLSGWTFDITGWIAVLLLFVLARVFEQGAGMREDIEGTV